MWTITFPKPLYKELEEFLFSTAPYENGCFLLAQAYDAGKRSMLLATDILKPAEGSWNSQGRHSLMPSSSFINECVVRSEATKSSLIFVHTHPDTAHPPTFSKIDRITNRKMFTNLSEIVPGRPLGSLVFSRHGVSGVVFDKARISSVKRVKIVGNTLTECNTIGTNARSSKTMAMFERQTRAFGTHVQQQIQNMSVTVIGVGGTGSSVSVQLARMGVKHIRLVDMDHVDESNLTRIYGSRKSDVGRMKVDVLRRHIMSFSRSTVTAICANVLDDSVLNALIESDVMFGCTDNHISRHRLNEISNRFYIPLIDVGCRIDVDDAGSISQAVAKIQAVTPESACLWCSGTLDGRTMLQESLPEEEKKKLAEEGYYEEVGKQPSVISLTTLAASMAVNKFLGIVGAIEDESGTRLQVELRGGFMISDVPEIRAECVCRKNMGVVFRNA